MNRPPASTHNTDFERTKMKRLLKFYKYALAWENYLLLGRAIRSAWLVRRLLPEGTPSPNFASALAAVEKLYLPPQPGWTISNPGKVIHFAGFVVNFPFEWGKCVQQSLIIYRLLNGYGVPAKICFGISRNEAITDGHAWVIRLDEPERAVAEKSDPRERFTLVYASPLPQSHPPL